MTTFMESSIDYKYKKSIEAELLLAAEALKMQDVVQSTPTGKLRKNPFAKRLGDENVASTITGGNVNVQEHFDDWIKMILYDESEMDEGNLTKMARLS